MTIGDRIRAKRTELGYTQKELADKLGYKSKASINMIEHGKRNLTQQKIKEIADALDTSPEYIMGWEIDQVFTFTDIQNKLNNYDQLSDALIPFIDVEFDVSELDEILQYAKYVASKRD